RSAAPILFDRNTVAPYEPSMSRPIPTRSRRMFVWEDLSSGRRQDPGVTGRAPGPAKSVRVSKRSRISFVLPESDKARREMTVLSLFRFSCEPAVREAPIGAALRCQSLRPAPAEHTMTPRVRDLTNDAVAVRLNGAFAFRTA